MTKMTPEMQSCIDECLRCYQTCLGMASNHCLEVGGKHVEPAHFRLMLACAEMCRTSAHLMLLGTEHHRHACAECAEICEACAKSCEESAGWTTAFGSAAAAPRPVGRWPPERRDAAPPRPHRAAASAGPGHGRRVDLRGAGRPDRDGRDPGCPRGTTRPRA